MSTDQVEILLVEDDPDDLDLTLRALSKDRVCNRIRVARDGEEALDFLMYRGAYSRRSPDEYPKLILLDLKLPKLDGLGVLRQIKRDPRTNALPVVILTSSNQERDMAEAYRLGANSYIQKPVVSDQFRSTLKQVGDYWLLVNQSPPAAAYDGKGHAPTFV